MHTIRYIKKKKLANPTVDNGCKNKLHILMIGDSGRIPVT